MRYFRNLRTYDMLSIQEKRSIMPFASEYLAKELAKREHAKRRRKRMAYLIKIEELNEEDTINTE